MNETPDNPPSTKNNEGEDSSLVSPPPSTSTKQETRSEPTYQQAIDDLKEWAHVQGNPGLLRGAVAHLEGALEDRKKE